MPPLGSIGIGSSIWNGLSTDFDPEDETANFGTRLAVEDKGGHLYDVITFAICQPEVSPSSNAELLMVFN